MNEKHSLRYSLDKFNFSTGQQVILLLCNYIQLIHLIAIVAVFLVPWAGTWLKVGTALTVLYLFPPLLARITLKLLPIRATCIDLSCRDYFVWWFLLNLQMVFCRFPFLEEGLRLFPGVYSGWLRLWGADIGKHTYWAAGLRILDRSFLDIGDGVVFGAGVHLNPHVVVRNKEGRLELLLAPIKIGDRALIGGYSLLTAGTEIAQDEITRAVLQSPPYSSWQGGKRIKKRSSETNAG